MPYLHLLGIILCLVTLIGALGGSLRFQENFYQEVFDLVDSDEGFEEQSPESKKKKDAVPEAPDVPGLDESSISQAAVEQPAAPEVAPADAADAATAVEEESAEVEAYDQEEVFASIWKNT